MDQQQFAQPSSSGSQSNVGGHSELPPDISQMDFQTIKAASETLKKNSKVQFSQSDLLKLLSYLEGELQARDVVIAALKSERLKNFIRITRQKQMNVNDPQAALFRDALAMNGSYVSGQSSAAAAQSENEIRQFANHQLEVLEETIRHQRETHFKLLKLMRDNEHKQKGLMRELEEEKRKHERDTAQGDDITYGLEVERTRLRQDLEVEKMARRKCEKELKKVQEQLEHERARQKQIVLLLLADRTKIHTKYIEERKRSEDLAQILSEEKQRVDTIAEGLEEESKKSLRMEAELEKQLQAFNAEKKLLNGTLAKEEKRIKEQECEIAQLKAENDLIRKQALPHRLGPKNVAIPQVPPKIGGLRNSNSSVDAVYTQDENASVAVGINPATSASPMISSVAKVVQPTATVSSVPVSGPTTGIARSIPTSQSLRQQPQFQSTINTLNTNDTGHSSVFSANKGSLPNATGAQSTVPLTEPSPSTDGVAATQKSTPTSRGVPPPIPPNKPIIPPKRESSATRLIPAGAVSAVAVAAAVNQPIKNSPNKDGLSNLPIGANKLNESSNLSLDDN